MNATRITDIVAPTGLAAYEALMVEARLSLGDESDKLKVAGIFAKRVVLEHDPRIDWETELRVFKLFVEILHHHGLSKAQAMFGTICNERRDHQG
jgi:hypothetical protein